MQEKIQEIYKNKTGLIGSPVSHSLSPLIHNSAYKSLGMDDFEYITIDVKKEELSKKIKAFSESFVGLNVTMPLKQEVIKYCDELTEDAKVIGGVNTLKFIDNKVFGYNTDTIGFIEALKKNNVSFSGKKMLVLGAGGAAKAVAYASKKNNIQVEMLYRPDEITLNKKLRTCDILINATPVGMDGIGCPIDDFDNNISLVVDLIYSPRETELLKKAKEKNIRCMNGLDMLFFQARASFEIWHGISFDEEIKELITV